MGLGALTGSLVSCLHGKKCSFREDIFFPIYHIFRSFFLPRCHQNSHRFSKKRKRKLIHRNSIVRWKEKTRKQRKNGARNKRPRDICLWKRQWGWSHLCSRVVVVAAASGPLRVYGNIACTRHTEQVIPERERERERVSWPRLMRGIFPRAPVWIIPANSPRYFAFFSTANTDFLARQDLRGGGNARADASRV